MFDILKVMEKVTQVINLLQAIAGGIDAVKKSNDEIHAATKEVLASNAKLLEIEQNRVA